MINQSDVSNATLHGKLESRVMSASSLDGDDVYNPQGDKLGTIKELMLDIEKGTVCYAVLSFGGFLGMGEKLFAVPWNALEIDTINKRFLLDATEERLKNAPGFDVDHWPNMADPSWERSIQSHYVN